MLSDSSSDSSPCSTGAAGSPFFCKLSFGVTAADTSTDDFLLPHEPIKRLKSYRQPPEIREEASTPHYFMQAAAGGTPRSVKSRKVVL